MTNVQSLLFYSGIFLSSIFFSWRYQRNYSSKCIKYANVRHNHIKEYIYFVLVIFLPVFVSTIRYNVGTDYVSYRSHYYHWSKFSFLDVLKLSNEPLSYILHPLARYLFGHEWGYFLLSSTIIMTFVTITVFYYKNEISVPLAIFIYYMLFWSFSLNGIRQMMAISIILYAYRYIFERKPLKYILFVSIASGFHTSALICIFFYLLSFRPSKISSLKRVIFYLCLGVSPLLMPLLLKIALKLDIFWKYAQNYELFFERGGLGFLIWVIPPLIPAAYYSKNINNKYRCLFDICVLQIPFQYVGYYVTYGSRISLYSLAGQIILVPLVTKSISNKKGKLLVKLYYVLWYLFYFIIRSYIWNHSEAFPFNSIL